MNIKIFSDDAQLGGVDNIQIDYGLFSIVQSLSFTTTLYEDGFLVYTGSKIELSLELGGNTHEIVFKGYIEGIERNLQGSINVSCVTGLKDIADCPPLRSSNLSTKNTTPLAFIKKLVKPFGVTVKTSNLPAKMKTKLDKAYQVNLTDSTASIISEICTRLDINPSGNLLGELEFVDSVKGTADLFLKEGDNLESFRHSENSSTRFSLYRVIGKSESNDGFKITDKNLVVYKDVEDTGVERYRPKVVKKHGYSATECADYAKFLRRNGVHRSIVMKATYPGWLDSSNELLRPGYEVALFAPTVQLTEKNNYTMTQISYSFSKDGGYSTNISFKDTILVDKSKMAAKRTTTTKEGNCFDKNTLEEIISCILITYGLKLSPEQVKKLKGKNVVDIAKKLRGLAGKDTSKINESAELKDK